MRIDLKERGKFEDLNEDERVTLKLVLKNGIEGSELD